MEHEKESQENERKFFYVYLGQKKYVYSKIKNCLIQQEKKIWKGEKTALVWEISS